MRYTLEQLLQMQSQPVMFEKAGWTPAGYSDDGEPLYAGGDDGEGGTLFRTESQLKQGMDEGYISGPGDLLPQDVLQWGGGDDFSWVNNKYGTNFGSGQDYLNYLYGPGGGFIPDSDYYVLPEGKTRDSYVNAPLSYDPPESGLSKWMPYILGGVGLAGMGGLLPGTTSIFGGGGAAAGAADAAWGVNAAPTFSGGASGAGIAGGASGGGTLSGLTAAEMAALGGAGAASGSGGFNVADFINSGSINGVQGALPPAIPGMGNGVGLTEAALAGLKSGGGSALGNILSGNASSDDWLSALGTAGSTALGLYGANQQANAFGDMANRHLDMGQPYRDKLLQSYQPGFSMADQPDFMNAMDIGAQAAARATSAQHGNPVDNPGAYAEMQKYISGSLALPQLNTYRSQLGSFGQLGTNTAGTAQMGQIQSQGGMYDALGYGLGQLTQPKNPYEDMMKGLMGGFKLNTGTSW